MERNKINADFLGQGIPVTNSLDDPSFLGFLFSLSPISKSYGLFGSLKDDVSVGDIGAEGWDLTSYSALEYLQGAKTGGGNMSNVIRGAEREFMDISLQEVSRMEGENASTVLQNIQTNFNKSETYPLSPDKLYDNSKTRSLFTAEAESLNRFITIFQDVCNNRPYMFQEIDGLNVAYRQFYNNKVDSYLGGGKDEKIKIKCLEDIKLSIHDLLDSYFRAVYSHKYRRMNVPRNLLKFDCNILVHDIRHRIPMKNRTANIDALTEQKVLDSVTCVLFKFKRCVLDLDSIGEELGTITNAESNALECSFAFTYEDVEVEWGSWGKFLNNNYLTRVEDTSSSRLSSIDTSDINASMMEDSRGGLNLGRLASNVFNWSTSGNQMGNVYDESWVGVVNRVGSALYNVPVSSLVSSLAHQGVRRLGENAPQPVAQLLRNFPSGPSF